MEESLDDAALCSGTEKSAALSSGTDNRAALSLGIEKGAAPSSENEKAAVLSSAGNKESDLKAKLSGKIAFKLYDTYGFPLDLTQDILKEKNLEVDLEEFNREMEIQRNRGKENWSGSGETKEDDLFFKLKEKYGETNFLGYEALEAQAKILAIEEIAANPRSRSSKMRVAIKI